MGCDLSLPSPPASQTLRSSSFPYASPYSIQPILTIPRPPVPISHLPNLLPSSVSRKAFVCHSCENCRGLGVFFPFWKTLRAYGDENSHFTQVFSFHIVAHSLAHAKTQLFSFQPLPHSLPQNTGGWWYPLVPPHPPHSTQGYSCWLASGSPLPTSVELLCYANCETTHEPRIRFTHRQNSRHPHLSPFHLGLHFCRHHLHHRKAVHQGTSGFDRHSALDRWRPDQSALLRFGSLPRTLPHCRRAALHNSRCLHHSLSLRRFGAQRPRPLHAPAC